MPLSWWEASRRQKRERDIVDSKVIAAMSQSGMEAQYNSILLATRSGTVIMFFVSQIATYDL